MLNPHMGGSSRLFRIGCCTARIRVVSRLWMHGGCIAMFWAKEWMGEFLREAATFLGEVEEEMMRRCKRVDLRGLRCEKC